MRAEPHGGSLSCEGHPGAAPCPLGQVGCEQGASLVPRGFTGMEVSPQRAGAVPQVTAGKGIGSGMGSLLQASPHHPRLHVDAVLLHGQWWRRPLAPVGRQVCGWGPSSPTL